MLQVREATQTVCEYEVAVTSELHSNKCSLFCLSVPSACDPAPEDCDLSQGRDQRDRDR